MCGGGTIAEPWVHTGSPPQWEAGPLPGIPSPAGTNLHSQFYLIKLFQQVQCSIHIYAQCTIGFRLTI